MRKERVHNMLEADVLIKEAYRNGTEDKYNECKFYTHEGELLFYCITMLTFYVKSGGVDGEETIYV